MQILGDLLRLPDDGRLPLPWWQRAPLGFLHDTTVDVAITEACGRPVGDIIVSVLNLTISDEYYRVRCQHNDTPGVIRAALETVKDINIALAETATVTIKKGRRNTRQHDITLVCESESKPQRRELLKPLQERGFTAVNLEPDKLPECCWYQKAKIEHGWLTGLLWKRAMQEIFKGADCDKVDFSRIVVSADTEQRVLRFVFPVKGAFTIRVTHRDSPSALIEITSAIEKCNLNVLSSFLRRGGVLHGNAEYLAVVEPSLPEMESVEILQDQLKQAIRTIPSKLSAEIFTKTGRACEGSIYLQHPDDVVAKAPNHLVPLIRANRRILMSGQMRPIFISARSSLEGRHGRIRTAVEDTLLDFDCRPVYADLHPGETPTTPDEVEAKMWACDAAIIIIAKGEDFLEGFSANITHEYGFFRGQGKPVLTLFEEGTYAEIIRKWSNLLGRNDPSFAVGDGAFDPKNSRSVYRLLKLWITEQKLQKTAY